MFKLYVIGFGYKPFTQEIRDIIYSADFILASERLFDFFEGLEEYSRAKDSLKVINNVDQTFDFIKSQTSNPESKIVLLASGDPLFYGIGRRAIKELGKEVVEIFPDLSSIQVAFAKIKESWDDAFLMSLHGGPDPLKRRKMQYDITDIPLLLQKHYKIAILTDKQNNPTKIAQALLDFPSLPKHSKDAVRMYVCEKLGYPDEKITEGLTSEIAKREYSHPNLVIILNNSLINKDIQLCNANISFGLSEDDIMHTNSLITKDEIRAITLHKLMLINKGVFWDVGAGSGSISVEAAKLCPKLKIYAIEKDSVQVENIERNKEKFRLQDINVISADAPSNLEGLPLPNRVFIGGSGGRLEEILKFISEKKVEIIVINATTIETLNKALLILERLGYSIDVSQINVSRMRNIGNSNYFSALNPVFIIRGRKVY